jgi:UDPglucose 6-dehydrogenase/GDP-mannose 6-dehydrogenase
MKISVIGTGYVGLVSGACLADRGHEVICVDLDRAKVERINSGHAPIHEPGLPELLARPIGKSLRATTDLAGAVAATDITLIAVGTPATDGRIDLKYVERASEEIGAALAAKRSYHVVAVKSTVIPGTTDGVVRKALERASGKKAGEQFGLGMNPEFLTEGRAVDDFMFPDRIVIGGIDARTRATLAEIYAPFAGAPRVETNNSTAELIKYTSNALLATLISFSNEIARLSAAVGDVDIVDVMRGVHLSSYLSPQAPDGTRRTAPIASFLEAGCGFGGSCLPKDVTALAAQGESLGLPMPMLRSVLDINRGQPDELIRLISKHHPKLQGVRVAVLGLAFKPDTDDVRESPAFPIVRKLREAGAVVAAYDPVARPTGEASLTDTRIANSLREAVEDADVVVLVTRWDQFQQLPAVLRDLGRRPLVVDGRRTLSPGAFATYEGIGRGNRVA